MQALRKDLYWLRGLGGFINAYLWQGDTLLDAGAPTLAHAFWYELRRGGFDPRSLRHAMVSHCHVDHAGGLQHLHQPLAVHGAADDLAVLRGDRTAPRYHPTFGFLVEAAEALIPRARLHGEHVTHPVAEGDEVNGWRIIAAPGHTPGSVLWYQPETRTVFVGDLLIHHFGFLQGPSPLFTEDYEQAVASLSRVKELEIELVLFGHGRPLAVDAERRLHRLIDRLQTRTGSLVLDTSG